MSSLVLLAASAIYSGVTGRVLGGSAAYQRALCEQFWVWCLAQGYLPPTPPFKKITIYIKYMFSTYASTVYLGISAVETFSI